MGFDSGKTVPGHDDKEAAFTQMTNRTASIALPSCL